WPVGGNSTIHAACRCHRPHLYRVAVRRGRLRLVPAIPWACSPVGRGNRSTWPIPSPCWSALRGSVPHDVARRGPDDDDCGRRRGLGEYVVGYGAALAHPGAVVSGLAGSGGGDRGRAAAVGAGRRAAGGPGR